MYSTKTIHKNINPNYPQIYNSIGDPYKTSLEELPDRWKQKQFITQRHPQNSGDGFFTKLEYQPEPYTELCEQGYAKTQPIEERKLGFGSHDAFKRDEFTNTTATERYRDMLRSESKLFSNRFILHHPSSRNETPLTQERRPPKGLVEPRFLYDVGRTHVTTFDPKNAHDRWYNIPSFTPIEDKKDLSRRFGVHKPMSASIGAKSWDYKYEKPDYGKVSFVSKFYDKGHLECRGF